MQCVEERLTILPPKTEEEKGDEVVNVLQAKQILAWAERLALPELCQQERLEIAESLKQMIYI